MKVGYIPFHSIPFRSVSFRSDPRKKSFALMKITKIMFMNWRNEILWKKKYHNFGKKCEYFESKLNKVINKSIFIAKKKLGG